MERNDCCIANVNGRNWRSLLLAHEVSDEIRLWVVRRRSQTRRTNTNEQDTYITVCKILNTKNTETQTDKIIHVIDHIRTCRKQISAKLCTADIFAFPLAYWEAQGCYRICWFLAASEVPSVSSKNSTILSSHIIRPHINLLFYSCLVPSTGFICWLARTTSSLLRGGSFLALILSYFGCRCFLLKGFSGTSSISLGFSCSLVVGISVRVEFSARTSYVLGTL